MTFGESVTDFLLNLTADFRLPSGIGMLTPVKLPETQKVVREFYRKFYNDHRRRVYIFGINPGRFGAGVTGIAFTDPIRLEEKCGIRNSFLKKPELSSLFVYRVIDAYGGARKFFARHFITALCPVGFVRDGKNLNYYDDKKLLAMAEPFITGSLRKQLSFGIAGRMCLCLGEGQNYENFSRLNRQHQFFDEIVPLPHPRWIMQYRRPAADAYVKVYLEALERVQKKGRD